MKKSRLSKAAATYCDALHELLTNPKSENLTNETVEIEIAIAYNKYIEELLSDETECAEFIAAGNRIDELNYLKTVFDHFKTEKIYEAIKANCEIAFSGKFTTESEELSQTRKELIKYMQQQLKINA